MTSINLQHPNQMNNNYDVEKEKIVSVPLKDDHEENRDDGDDDDIGDSITAKTVTTNNTSRSINSSISSAYSSADFTLQKKAQFDITSSSTTATSNHTSQAPAAIQNIQDVGTAKSTVEDAETDDAESKNSLLRDAKDVAVVKEEDDADESILNSKNKQDVSDSANIENEGTPTSMIKSHESQEAIHTTSEIESDAKKSTGKTVPNSQSVPKESTTKPNLSVNNNDEMEKTTTAPQSENQTNDTPTEQIAMELPQIPIDEESELVVTEFDISVRSNKNSVIGDTNISVASANTRLEDLVFMADGEDDEDDGGDDDISLPKKSLEEEELDKEQLQIMACKFAKEMYHDAFLHSTIIDETHSLPKFAFGEIVEGDFLGKGGFGTVSEVQAFSLRKPAALTSPITPQKSVIKITSLPPTPVGNGSTTSMNPNESHRSSTSIWLQTADQSKRSDATDASQTSDTNKKILEKSDSILRSPNKTPKKLLRRLSSSSVVEFSLPEKNDNANVEHQERGRQFLAQHCLREEMRDEGHGNGDTRYAIKRLLPHIIDNHKDLVQGIADMATETRMLASMEHPNIIKIRGMAIGSFFQPNYFILLDRLYDTLNARFQVWEEEYKRYTKGLCNRLWKDPTGRHAKNQITERLVSAFDLASAICYLHERRIMHRDIKPENIGFDVRGDIKVFDFGFAKEMPSKGEDANGLYKLTEMCGSPIYMAPEVALDKPYNEKCDVYSFAIILWEFLTLKRAFHKHSVESLSQNVWSGRHNRPAMGKKFPEVFKKLLHKAWSPFIHDRPSMKDIEGMLKEEILKSSKGNDAVFQKVTQPRCRRSTFVLDKSEQSTGSKHGTAGAIANFLSTLDVSFSSIGSTSVHQR